MNKVVHFEIPTENLRRASSFYEKTFGWQLSSYQPTYTIAKTGETDANQMPAKPGYINGALMEDDSVDMPVLVIAVDDLDAAIQLVRTNGGKLVMSPREVPNMGTYARVQDTEGNIIGLWKNLEQ